jgi:hypothetical protein
MHCVTKCRVRCFRKIAKSDYELRRVCLSVCLSVRPSIRVEQLGSHWTDFHEIWYLSVFRKSVEKIQVSLKYDRNNGTWHEDLCTFVIESQLFLEWEMFQTTVLEKIKTHILCSITFSRKWCRLWDNVKKYGKTRVATDDNIIRRMRIECWIIKATDTHWEYVILIAFPLQ